VPTSRNSDGVVGGARVDHPVGGGGVSDVVPNEAVREAWSHPPTSKDQDV
jgi:hypothetical protein